MHFPSKNMAPPNHLAEDILEALASIVLLPRRLSLQTPGVEATAPMLRGVWGAALHGIDKGAYEIMFQGAGPPSYRCPGYILRPAPFDPGDAPAIEWILFGDAIGYDATAWRAWDIACSMGLGKRREPFRIWQTKPIAMDGMHLNLDRTFLPWRLSQAHWPIPGNPFNMPVRLKFDAPLRILRRKRLIDCPTFKDIVEAGLGRLTLLMPKPLRPKWRQLRDRCLEAAEDRPGRPWRGRRLDLLRYSASQESEIELRGVAGTLDLPEGLAELWPLLAAMRWTHVGKGCVVGLGHLIIETTNG